VGSVDVIKEPANGIDPVKAQASSGPRAAIGSRVRLYRVDGQGFFLLGTIRQMDDSSITLETAGGPMVRTLRREIDWLQVEVPVGSSEIKGAAIGGGIGFLIGAVLGLSLCDQSCTGTSDWRLYAVTYGGAAGAIFGGGLGWLEGRGVPGHGWVQVPHTAPSPEPSGEPLPPAVGPRIPPSVVPDLNEAVAMPRHLSVNVIPILGRDSQGLRLKLGW
jgi:hypothetical protein